MAESLRKSQETVTFEQAESAVAVLRDEAKTTKGSPPRGAMAAIFLAVFVANFAMVAPAALNGVIQVDLHATGSQLSWITAIFFIPTAALELTFGVVGNLVGRKRLLVLGAAVLAVGDGIGILSPNVPTLMTGQAIAGVGAAILFPTTLASVASLTPDPRSRAKGIAMFTMAIAVGGAVGPTVSGIIGLHGSFRWAFGLAFALAVASALVSAVWAPDSRGSDGRGLDITGQILFVVGLTAILYGVIEGANSSYGSAKIVTCLIGGLALLVVFVVVEFRVKFSLINTKLFRSVTYSGATLVGLISAVGFFGFNYCVSLRVGVIQGQDSLTVGLTSTLQAGVSLIIWPVLGRFLYRATPRWVMTGGLVSMAASQFWLAAIPITDKSIVSLIPPLLLAGFGFVAVVSSTSGAVVDVPQEQEGIASGTISMARDTGAAIGIAAIGAIAFAQATAALPAALAKFGITGGDLAKVDHVAAIGGPVAVAHADLGPLAARSIPAAQEALWHGFSLGFVWCGGFSVVAVVLALFMIRAKARQPIGAETQEALA